jgi:hypothetical protein
MERTNRIPLLARIIDPFANGILAPVPKPSFALARQRKVRHFPRPQDEDGEIVMFSRLGGLLKSYRKVKKAT